MTFSQSDFPHIKWSLLIFLITLILGGATVFVSQKFAHNSQESKRNAQQQLNDARSRLNAARDDQTNMSAYTKEFSAIQRLNIIGDEQRLNLIEDLDTLRRRNLVVDFKYTVAPQQPYTPAPALDSGNFDLKYSNMKLQIELLHEEQLINFFDSLRRDINGWFILEKCSLERASAASAQLKADCEGGWLTMKNRNAK